MNEEEVRLMLRERYADPAFAFLPHVREGTGVYAGRTADAVAMGVWPSRGFELLGFEIKCSRSDWLREVRNPAKADGLFAYMDRWWIVTSDKSMVYPGELPPTWGWIAVMGTQLRVQVEAPKLDPKPLTHVFLAAILRQASRQVYADDQIAKVKRDAEAEGYARGLKDGHRDEQYGRPKESEAVAAIQAFKAASGIDLYSAGVYRVGQIGDIVKWWLDYQQPGAGLLTALSHAETLSKQLTDAVALIRADGAVPEVFRR